jgi:hypothetical protein
VSSPKAPKVPPPAPPPAPPSPIGEQVAPTVKTAATMEKAEVTAKRARRRGTSSLQTSSGLNIPTSSGYNIA